MDELDDTSQHARVRGGGHAVAEVDPVARCGLAAGDDVAHVGLQHLPRRGQQRRVDVALHGGDAAQAGDAVVEGQAVVDADDVGARVAHVREDLGGAGAEVHARHAEVRDGRQDARGVRGDVGAVVGARQGAGPRVEELDGPRAGAHLGAEEGGGEVGGPGQEAVPGGGVGVHHRARREVVARRAPLHQVGGQRERGAAEADERGGGAAGLGGVRGAAGGRGVQFGDGPAHGLFDRRVVAGLVGGQAVHVRGVAHGFFDDGPDAGHDLHAHPGQAQGHDDVAEEDRRVHVVAAHRLERDLGGELGDEARVQHRHALAGRPVLRQRAARLAHEPHRTVRALALRAPAAHGGEQRREGGGLPGVAGGGVRGGGTGLRGVGGCGVGECGVGGGHARHCASPADGRRPPPRDRHRIARPTRTASVSRIRVGLTNPRRSRAVTCSTVAAVRGWRCEAEWSVAPPPRTLPPRGARM